MKNIICALTCFCCLILPDNTWGQESKKYNLFIDPLSYKPEIDLGGSFGFEDMVKMINAEKIEVERYPNIWKIDLAIFSSKSLHSWRRLEINVNESCVGISCKVGVRF